ncbi:hypothetical protein [Rhodoblastus sp.]|uniref:hypothetical protein n=1 Tax=Rhodoblastus sp. TaxID=1962975 RepID=UPI003F9B37BB
MSDDATKTDHTPKKKQWAGPKIVNIGSVDSQTTAGTGNVGDQATSQQRYRAGSYSAAEDAKAILPQGE